MSANGSNNFLNIEDANLRVRSGSLHAKGMVIGGITVGTAHGLQSVTDTSNTTSNTLQFTNATTAFKATSNIELTSATKIIVDSNVVTEYTGLATTLKSVYDVPATTGTQLEVYYDAKDLTTMPSIVTDLAGGDQNGSVSSVTLDITDGIESFNFDGTLNNAITTTLPSTFVGNQVHSVAFWFYYSSTKAVIYPFHIGTQGPNDSIGMWIGDGTDGSGIYLNYFFYSNDCTITSHNPLVVGTWNHIALVHNGTDLERKLYINNTQIEFDTNSNNGPLSLPASSTLYIGRSSYNSAGDATIKMANFRLYSKALNAEQVQELYDYQKDYFLGSKSQLTLYKGHLGVGVTEPSGQLELAGDERIQEYPPRALYQYDTNIEGHGVFCVSASNEYDPNHPAWEAFGDNATSASNGESVWNTPGSLYSTTSGLYTGSTTTAGINGEWIQMKAPYKLKIYTLYLDSYLMSASGRQPRNFTLLGSNDGNVWEQMKTVTDQTTGYTMAWPYSTSTGGPTHTINSTKYYSYFRIVVTATQDNTKSGTLPDGLTAIGRIKFFGTPGPTTLDKGSLTLGRSLDVPRVSRYDVDTETPRPEKLVVDYDTTVNSSPTDISGRGNHGTLVGATYSAADKAFDFSGNNVIYTPSLSPSMTGDIICSMSCWFKTDNSTTRQTVMWIGDDGAVADFIDIRIKGGYIGLSMGWDPDTSMLGIKYTDQALENNRWYHVVGVKSGTGPINSSTTAGMLQLYLDGVKLNTVDGGLSDSIGLSIPTNHNQLTIGASNENGTGNTTLVGQISNSKLYSVALEPSEVRKLYNLGRTGRSMVISDTAVGIGKAPEAQLDVRGLIKAAAMHVPGTVVQVVTKYDGSQLAYTSSSGNPVEMDWATQTINPRFSNSKMIFQAWMTGEGDYNAVIWVEANGVDIPVGISPAYGSQRGIIPAPYDGNNASTPNSFTLMAEHTISSLAPITYRMYYDHNGSGTIRLNRGFTVVDEQGICYTMITEVAQ